MSLRAIASATVSFGLVSIPVKIFSAANSAASVRFNMIERETGARVKQQYVSTKTGEIVPRSAMCKGYEFSKGQYVLFSDEEMKALQAEASQSIDIAEFIPADQVPSLYFDKSYFLGPDKGGERAYHLLTGALDKVERAALARYSARGKMYLVLVKPHDGGLMMQQLHYANELRDMGEVPLGDKKTKKAELELALQIIEQAKSERFKPEQYRDEVSERMLAAIERKVEGQEITLAEDDSPKAQVIDLMDALKASLSNDSTSKAKRKPAKKSGRAAKSTRKKSARKKVAKKS